ncbi:hypothetical protein THRCLA_02421 [Thraustotheca clavata]|uniref:Uncharacterized protein n=1 Tax=Thraustotheca clavata TaxID=74557 RepID=A0A1W0A588_9STRA|nr:hypothetical protein THRCLA_02421 [Thraustotheca clavata]
MFNLAKLFKLTKKIPQDRQRAAEIATPGHATKKPRMGNKIDYLQGVVSHRDKLIHGTPNSSFALDPIPSKLVPTSIVKKISSEPIDGATTPIQSILLKQDDRDQLGNEPLKSPTIPNSWSSDQLSLISLEDPNFVGENVPEHEEEPLVCDLENHQNLEKELELARATIAAQDKRILELEAICKQRTESEWEAQVRRLKRQLENAGIQVAVNMNYDDIKQKMKDIAAKMGEIEGGPNATHTDKKLQAQLRRKYFDLELEMDKLYSAMVASDEYEVEMKEKETTWHRNNIEVSREALVRIRNCIPVNVSAMTTEVLVDELHLHKNAAVYAKRLKSLKALNLLRMDPQKLCVLHPCELVQLSFSKLSILEKKALYGAISDIADEWSSQPSNTFFVKKLDWFKSLRNGLMSELSALEMHLQPEHECTLGSQCPATVQAKLDLFYETPCIFPRGSEFPVDGHVIPIATPPSIKPKTSLPVAVKSSNSDSKKPQANFLLAIQLRPKIE